jgi:hypothetical protein
MSVNKADYEIGDLIYARSGLPDEAALIIGVDDRYETYKLMPLRVSPLAHIVTNERMSFHVAHKYFQRV